MLHNPNYNDKNDGHFFFFKLEFLLALSLHGAASKIQQRTIGGSPYPMAVVAAGAQGPRARRASVQMEAMGLWRPSLNPVQLGTTY